MGATSESAPSKMEWQKLEWECTVSQGFDYVHGNFRPVSDPLNLEIGLDNSQNTGRITDRPVIRIRAQKKTLFSTHSFSSFCSAPHLVFRVGDLYTSEIWIGDPYTPHVQVVVAAAAPDALYCVCSKRKLWRLRFEHIVPCGSPDEFPPSPDSIQLVDARRAHPPPLECVGDLLTEKPHTAQPARVPAVDDDDLVLARSINLIVIRPHSSSDPYYYHVVGIERPARGGSAIWVYSPAVLQQGAASRSDVLRPCRNIIANGHDSPFFRNELFYCSGNHVSVLNERIIVRGMFDNHCRAFNLRKYREKGELWRYIGVSDAKNVYIKHPRDAKPLELGVSVAELPAGARHTISSADIQLLIRPVAGVPANSVDLTADYHLPERKIDEHAKAYESREWKRASASSSSSSELPSTQPAIEVRESSLHAAVALPSRASQLWCSAVHGSSYILGNFQSLGHPVNDHVDNKANIARANERPVLTVGLFQNGKKTSFPFVFPGSVIQVGDKHTPSIPVVAAVAAHDAIYCVCANRKLWALAYDPSGYGDISATTIGELGTSARCMQDAFQIDLFVVQNVHPISSFPSSYYLVGVERQLTGGLKLWVYCPTKRLLRDVCSTARCDLLDRPRGECFGYVGNHVSVRDTLIIMRGDLDNRCYSFDLHQYDSPHTMWIYMGTSGVPNKHVPLTLSHPDAKVWLPAAALGVAIGERAPLTQKHVVSGLEQPLSAQLPIVPPVLPPKPPLPPPPQLVVSLMSPMPHPMSFDPTSPPPPPPEETTLSSGFVDRVFPAEARYESLGSPRGDEEESKEKEHNVPQFSSDCDASASIEPETETCADGVDGRAPVCTTLLSTSHLRVSAETSHFEMMPASIPLLPQQNEAVAFPPQTLAPLTQLRQQGTATPDVLPVTDALPVTDVLPVATFVATQTAQTYRDHLSTADGHYSQASVTLRNKKKRTSAFPLLDEAIKKVKKKVTATTTTTTAAITSVRKCGPLIENAATHTQGSLSSSNGSLLSGLTDSICPRCEKTFVRVAAFSKHVATCTATPVKVVDVYYSKSRRL